VPVVKTQVYNCRVEAAAFRGLLFGAAASAGFWGMSIYVYRLLVGRH
jgi:hypothetical protein